MIQVTLVQDGEDKRIELGLSYLEKSLGKAGCTVRTEEWRFDREDSVDYRGSMPSGDRRIYAGVRGESDFLRYLEENDLLVYHAGLPEGEGFAVSSIAGGIVVIAGGSRTGTLYGCLELAERIEEAGELPWDLDVYDAPAYKLRGTMLGLQKTRIEPPRRTYEYPITPGRFPWFYDKEQWTEYLEMMTHNRCNVLYIWSGHPFASLVKVPDYPEALEVTEEELKRNHEVFLWLTEECDRRGIWVVLKFYNIHIPYEFAVYHGIDPHQSSIDPLVADYTRKTIAEFIKTYPHIGLMVCLGEALRGLEAKTEWFVGTILPGVKDGIEAAGLTEEPPVILRGHDCDPVSAMQQGLQVYSNLYTMWKYNGEGLTSARPRGNWQKQHLAMASLGSRHIVNVHILADLEPFRYGAPGFIRKCMQAARYRLGGNGLHLYPLFYWDWPYSPDKAEPRLLQVRRDWLWNEAWLRYAWNPDRDDRTERYYWIRRIAEQYECPEADAEKLLDAAEAAGQLAPRSLGRIGITEGNRQTWSLGMTLSQMTNVERYHPNLELWHSVADQGEQPAEYVRKEISGEPHFGETPPDMIRDTDYFAAKALQAAEGISADAIAASPELGRWQNDIRLLADLTDSYNRKLEAALLILRYRYTMDGNLRGDLSLLESAREKLGASLASYRKLTALGEETYLYANSMQTPQRKIPFPNGEIYGHWSACLPEYEKEYANFCRHVDEMQTGIYPEDNDEAGGGKPLKPAPFTLLSEGCETYTVRKGGNIFEAYKIESVIPEIAGLTGVRFPLGDAVGGRVRIRLRLEQDSRILIGYVNEKDIRWLAVPTLETNTHADDRGGLSPVYTNAMRITGGATVNIHMLRYEKGEHVLGFDNGGFVLAGVISADEPVTPRAAEASGRNYETLDWLYEE